jgi:hypothetical protein
MIPKEEPVKWSEVRGGSFELCLFILALDRDVFLWLYISLKIPLHRQRTSDTRTWRIHIVTMAPSPSLFPIPSSLQDLEREPYNLLPYPEDFNDDDDGARTDSFNTLVSKIEQGNRYLTMQYDQQDAEDAQEDEDEQWMEEGRLQAIYTLVR